MPTRNLPPRPDLIQLKRQAQELLRAHRARKTFAAARIVAHHPRMKGHSTERVLDRKLSLADAQLVLAREYGFPSWAALKDRLQIARRVARFTPHPRFAEALDALRGGDAVRLRQVITEDPALVRARANLDPRHGYFTGAMLLHYVAANPGWDVPVPENIVEIARVLLEAGADANASTLAGPGGTTLGLVATSHQASEANISGPLIDLLLEYGATVDVDRPDVLYGSLANYGIRAAERLIELGAKPDVCAAAALGRMELLRSMFDGDGRLRADARPRRGRTVLTERDAIGLALLFAYVSDRADAVDFLLEKDGNWNMIGVNNGTVLHRAAWDLSLIHI